MTPVCSSDRTLAEPSQNRLASRVPDYGSRPLARWKAGFTEYVPSQYTVYGGVDVEPQWSSPSPVLSFYSGFNNNHANGLICWDFGYMDGNTNASGTDYTYPSPWTPNDLYEVTWGDAASYPYPELYDGTSTGDTGHSDWGVQNAQVDQYSDESGANGPWAQMGVATEAVSGQETPSEAFSDQENALHSYGLESDTPMDYHTQFQPLAN